MTIRFFPSLKSPSIFADFASLNPWLRNVYEVVSSVRHGKMDCVGTITLTASVASTTLTDSRLSPQSVVTFDPTTAHAATELYGATMYVLTADRSNGAFVITHANKAQTDRIFSYSIIG